ncbi:MAG: peptide chain release factor 2 [Syntrophobacterales bacterium]|nr:peptide chain release factor 2 [Syntrophobacterales bacterium]
MIEDILREINSLEKRVCSMKGYLDLEGSEDKIKNFEKQISKDDFWNDPENARKILQEKNKLELTVENWRKKHNLLKDLRILIDMAIEEDDEDTVKEVERDLNALKSSIRDEELKMMLSEEADSCNAIVTIHAGAGGTEAQDWAEMLLRMYLRWSERKKYTTGIIDFQPGDEAGVKSVTFTLEGEYAYGYAKAEAGIHRLVRISPFDTGGRRHTSFASVFVYPEINNDIIVEIDEKDLRIDTYRSTGAGGQHVNKTDSAVRITHVPSGIVVQCQNERSQHKNKAVAMKVLKSRLYEMRRQEENEKLRAMDKSKKTIAFGSQIRSYILHPYRMVKDHRTDLEVGNVNRVLDGDIDEFIEAYLMG